MATRIIEKHIAAGEKNQPTTTGENPIAISLPKTDRSPLRASRRLSKRRTEMLNLMTKGVVAIPNLAVRLGCSERSVKRDLHALDLASRKQLPILENQLPVVHRLAFEGCFKLLEICWQIAEDRKTHNSVRLQAVIAIHSGYDRLIKLSTDADSLMSIQRMSPSKLRLQQ